MSAAAKTNELFDRYIGKQGHGNPREAAKALIEVLAAANDAQSATFASHMKANDPKHLAHLLLAPCHFDLEAIRYTASGDADLAVQ